MLARGGRPYKPSAVRGYEQSLRLHVYPELGDRKFASVGRRDLQALVDKLHRAGMSPSTVVCALLPLRAMYRRALNRGEITVNPCAGLEMPANREHKRDRIADPKEAARLLAALPEADRPVWTAAMYSGLRRCELVALHWEDVDLDAGIIRVRRGWDFSDRIEIPPKSKASSRNVPIVGKLRAVLAAHKLASEHTGPEDYVFGNGNRVLDHRRLAERADAAWKAAGLNRITLHECRHTYASLMIAAGVNAKALTTYMGHGSIQVTWADEPVPPFLQGSLPTTPLTRFANFSSFGVFADYPQFAADLLTPPVLRRPRRARRPVLEGHADPRPQRRAPGPDRARRPRRLPRGRSLPSIPLPRPPTQ